jgi:deoxycytidine triphosphate deaminase
MSILNPQLMLDSNVVSGGKVQQAGIDLTLAKVELIASEGLLTKAKSTLPDYIPVRPVDDFFELKSGCAYSITFNEGVKLPDNVSALVIHRSSLNRMGVDIISGLYDPGFETARCGAILRVMNTVRIQKDARVAQIVCFETESASSYDGQFQGK